MCAQGKLSCPEMFAKLSKHERLTAIEMLLHGLQDLGDFELFVSLIDACLSKSVKNEDSENVVKEISDRHDLTGGNNTIQDTSSIAQDLAILENSNEVQVEVNSSENDRKGRMDMSHACEECVQQFTLLKSLRRHFEQFHCGKKRPFNCDLCDKQWTRKADLDAHKTVHVGDTSLTCSVCLKSFSRPHHLRNHERTHTGELISCDKCDKQFTCESNRTSHIRRFHDEGLVVKPFVCDICQKRWISKADMEKHRRIHTGEKPYTCTICPKSFTRLYHLNLHGKVHTGEELVKPYSCSHCPKMFAESQGLKRHAMIHTGEKAHSCKICGRAFTQKGDLKCHENVVHFGIYPFSCDTCGCSFGNKTNLNRHMSKCS